MASRKIICISDAAYVAQAQAQANSIIQEASVWAAIQIAMMLAQRDSSSAIADMQEELASRRMVLAEEMLQHAKKTWAKESAFVQETMAVPRFEPSYLDAQLTINEANRVETLAVNGTTDKLARLGITPTVCDEPRVRRGMATARTDLVSHSMRSAEARAIALNDRRYSRQIAVVGMGRGILQNARSMGQLGGSANSVRNSLIRTINSGMSLWGYTANRWQHGGNFATGENGAPVVVPGGKQLVETTDANTNRVTLSVQTDRQADAMTSVYEDFTSPNRNRE